MEANTATDQRLRRIRPRRAKLHGLRLLRSRMETSGATFMSSGGERSTGARQNMLPATCRHDTAAALPPIDHKEAQRKVKMAIENGSSGALCVDGWSGFAAQPIELLGVVGKKSARIKAKETRVYLAGKRRYIEPGEIATVPAYAIRITP